jgi:hypothetical protein
VPRQRADQPVGASPTRASRQRVCPESCGGLTGKSPVGAKQPRSWWPAEGETRLSKRHDQVPLGEERVFGPYERNPAASIACPCRCRGKAGAEPCLWGRRPWTAPRTWPCTSGWPGQTCWGAPGNRCVVTKEPRALTARPSPTLRRWGRRRCWRSCAGCLRPDVTGPGGCGAAKGRPVRPGGTREPFIANLTDAPTLAFTSPCPPHWPTVSS